MTPQKADWQLMCKKWSQRGAHLLQNGLWADCKFSVGDESNIVSAHRLLLAMASPVFEVMFYGGMPESGDCIKIPDMEIETFKAMLKFIYEEKINIVSVENATSLAYAGHKYMLPQLVEMCTIYIKNNLDYHNAIQTHEFGYSYNNSELKEASLTIICNNTSKILSENLHFSTDMHILEEIFDQEFLNINDELDLFKALERYSDDILCDSPPPMYDEMIRSILGKMRFLTLTPERFCEEVLRTKLLTQSEVITIMERLIMPQSDTPMPEGFSTSVVHRNPLLYCKRIFVNEKFWENTGVSIQYVITITADQNILVYGFQVPTQKGNIGETYEEHIEAFIGMSDEFATMGESNLYHHPLYNGIQDIYFDTPCRLRKGINYDIRIQFNKSGTYLCGTGSPTVRQHNVSIEFYSSQPRGNALTRSIIFKIDKQ